MHSAQAEEGRILERLTAERAAKRAAEAGLKRDEGAIVALQSQMELHAQGLKQIDGEIQAQQQRLDDLRGQRAACEAEQQARASRVRGGVGGQVQGWEARARVCVRALAALEGTATWATHERR